MIGIQNDIFVKQLQFQLRLVLRVYASAPWSIGSCSVLGNTLSGRVVPLQRIIYEWDRCLMCDLSAKPFIAKWP
jgi:hypothetical protein